MNCPIERGGCGKKLKWDEGAFCEDCMKKVKDRLDKVKIINAEALRGGEAVTE